MRAIFAGMARSYAGSAKAAALRQGARCSPRTSRPGSSPVCCPSR